MSYVGQSIQRIEDLRLLRGRGKYVDDLHHEGMVHAAILRSSVPHGRIRKIDSKKARSFAKSRNLERLASIAIG